MIIHRSIRSAKRRAFPGVAPIVRAFTASLGLPVLLLLLFAGPADAACYLRLNTSMLPQLQVVLDDSARTVYRGAYLRVIHSPVCEQAIGWSIDAIVHVGGQWDKVNKIATESIGVSVKTQLGGTAKYSGKTTQKCAHDPWAVYQAGCKSWLYYVLWGVPNAGVTRAQSSSGWHTSQIPWNGFDYRGPYPAARPVMGCCWFEPWGGY